MARFALILIFVMVLVVPAASSDPEFIISLGYYASPIKKLEWKITVTRAARKIVIDIDNYNGRRLARELSVERYASMVEMLVKNGIWNLKGQYDERSRNGYYLIEVWSAEQKNSFKVEAGPALTGSNMRYREIIRRITNEAMLVIRD
jgi:hypothetical protein